MIQTIFDYTRKMAVDEPILAYQFDEDLRHLLAPIIQFEEDDSNFSPGPSIRCRLRNDNGFEFLLIFLQYCGKLHVYAEANVDRSASTTQFMMEFPELEFHHLNTWR